MKDQRTRTEKRSVLRVLSAVMLMLALTVLSLTVVISAAGQTPIEIKAEHLEVKLGSDPLAQDANGYYKVYDGTSTVSVAIKSDATIANLDPADFDKVSVKEAYFADESLAAAANVNDVKYIVVKFNTFEGEMYDKYGYSIRDVRLPAHIVPRALTWGGSAKAEYTYDPSLSAYEIKTETVTNIPALSGNLASLADEIAGVTADVISVNPLEACGVSDSNTTTATVSLSNANFTAPALEVTVKVNPITIVGLQLGGAAWDGNLTLTYGDAMPKLTALGSDGKIHDVITLTCQNTGFAAGNAGQYNQVLADWISGIDSNNYTWGDALNRSCSVTIQPRELQVYDMKDILAIGDEKTNFYVSVAGKNLPQDALNLIQYYIKDTTTPFNGTAAYGKVTVVAKLPTDNYRFNLINDKGEVVTNNISTLEAEITLLRQEKQFPVLNEKGETVGSVILVNRDGFSDNVTATVTAVDAYPRIFKSNRYNQSFKISLGGDIAEGQAFTLIIPLLDEVLAPLADKLTPETLYVYEPATKSLIPANAVEGRGYQVELGKGYYQLENFTGTGETTFVIATDYNTPFFYTPMGIAALLLLIALIILLPCYIGLHLRRITDERENPVVVVDADGILPPRQPIDVIQVPEREPVDENAVLAEELDGLADSIDVPAAEEEIAPADEDEVRETVDESLQQIFDEAALLSLDVPAEEAEDDDTTGEEMAERIAAELDETVEADDGIRGDRDVIDQAVAEAMDEITAANESADAEDAVELAEEIVEEPIEEPVEEAIEEPVEEPIEEPVEEPIDEAAAEEEAGEIVAEIVTEEAIAEEAEETKEDSDEDDDSDDDNDDNNDDDDDGDAVEASADPFGFAAAADPSTFIDVKENPEEYQAMLERESRGEIRIISRYKKSFTAKLAQSLGNVQDYYSELKNALLAYKGVKNRLSWNYEAFNKGRSHVAKMIAKARTLYLYLAIDPATLAETKYSFVDVSSKKKYASTPVLLKIKGDRKFKHALELIAMLCGDQMQLPRTEKEATDYRVPPMTIEEMVQAGYMKHMAGYIMIAPVETAEPTENTEQV